MRAAFEYALDFERTGGRAQELAIMTKVCCSEAAVTTIYDCMRVVGIASYTKDLAPLERIMRDAVVFPLYDGGNQGVRRRQLHEMLRQPAMTRCWPPAGHPGQAVGPLPSQPRRLKRMSRSTIAKISAPMPRKRK